MKLVSKIRNIKLKKYGALYLMMVPALIYFIINNYLPMFGIIIAFKNVNLAKGILKSEWIGLKNFEYLFKTTDAWLITRNTLLYNIAFIIINLITAVGIAILLNEVKNRYLARFYQSVVLLPYLISMVIVGYLAFSLFSAENGLMNKTILPLLGMEEILWYGQPKYWPVILIIINTWKNAGYLCVVYYAAIIGIDNEIYEAAEIDGANRMQTVFKITVPLIMQVVIIMTLLQIGRIFYSDFGLFYQVPLDSGALLNATNVIDTYVYRALMTLGDIGMSSAAGIYQSVVGLVLITLSNYAVRKIDKDSALF